MTAQARPALAAGGQSSGSVSVTIPASTCPGTYFVIARADADAFVAEANENNNVLAHALEIGMDLTVSSLTGAHVDPGRSDHLRERHHEELGDRDCACLDHGVLPGPHGHARRRARS